MTWDGRKSGQPLPVEFHNPYVEHLITGRHKNLVDLPGFGGASGKAVCLVSTYAELKAACEDAAVGRVYCLEGTFTGGTTIAPTSYTHIIGIGHVQLDWNGAAAGFMFDNTSATNIHFENLHFVKTGNAYYIRIVSESGFRSCSFDGYAQPRLGNVYTDCRMYMEDCFVDGIYGSLCIVGYVINFRGCHIVSKVLVFDAVDVTFEACRFDSYNCVYVHASNTYHNSDLRLKFIGCYWLYVYNALYFEIISEATVGNVKLIGCTLDAISSAYDLIIVRDHASLTVNDVSCSHCIFRGAGNAYTIGANATVARWRFDNNHYPGVTTRYNFTDPGSFIYTMDG